MRAFANRRFCLWIGIAFFIIILLVLQCLNTINSMDKSQSQTLIRQEAEENSQNEFVLLDAYVPFLAVDLRYATDRNVFGEKVYENSFALLRKGTADKLRKAQLDFLKRGYRLKVWDAYRPLQAQFKLWEICPDPNFVADPHQGYSKHSRGCAVDVTLLDRFGVEIPMPSAFDDFSPQADRSYDDVDEIEALNARLLEEIMLKHGFRSIRTEWWHFEDLDKDQYDVIDNLSVLKQENKP